MAKQVRGSRANKPNDSFGVINNPNLYRNKYREEVDKEDEDNEVLAQDPTQEEEVATQEESASFVSSEKPEETPKEQHDYKKRYDDLKRHYDQKIQEFKSKEQQMQEVATQNNVTLPKTPEELERFKEEYPDVYDVVQTIASMKANEQSQQLKGELETIKAREKESLVKVAYRELKSLHPDFENIKGDEKFLNWLNEQPKSISDGILENNTNARLASRVIDLYKADMGITTKKASKKPDVSAATAVKSPQARDIIGEKSGNKKIWKMSDIARLKSWEFEKFEKEIDQARAEGRITQ